VSLHEFEGPIRKVTTRAEVDHGPRIVLLRKLVELEIRTENRFRLIVTICFSTALVRQQRPETAEPIMRLDR
jgi:hypothetical protein